MALVLVYYVPDFLKCFVKFSPTCCFLSSATKVFSISFPWIPNDRNSYPEKQPVTGSGSVPGHQTNVVPGPNVLKDRKNQPAAQNPEGKPTTGPIVKPAKTPAQRSLLQNKNLGEVVGAAGNQNQGGQMPNLIGAAGKAAVKKGDLKSNSLFLSSF